MSSRYLRMTMLVLVYIVRKRKNCTSVCAIHKKKRGREKERKLIDIYQPIEYLFSCLVFLLVKRNEEKKKKTLRSIIMLLYTCSRERSNRNDARLCV